MDRIKGAAAFGGICMRTWNNNEMMKELVL